MSGAVVLYRKLRDAKDVAGNLAWSVKVGDKALIASETAPGRVEDILELLPEERVIWRLLRLPRRLGDLERCGHIQVDAMRGVIRGLLAVEFVDIVDGNLGKSIIPAELRRLRAEIDAGGSAPPSPASPGSPASSTLKAKVYRPDIGLAPPVAPASVSTMPPRSNTPVPLVPRMQTPKPTTNDVEFKQMIERRSAASATQNHYAFFGVQPSATDAQLKQAYTQLAKDLHPDHLASSFYRNDPAMRAHVDGLFHRLQEAHNALQPDKRGTYDRSIGIGVAPPQARGRQPAEARQQYQLAEAAMGKRDYVAAETHYKEAAQLDPVEPRIIIALAWCIFSNPSRPQKARAEEARDKLSAIWRESKHPEAAYRLGRVHRELGDEENAIKCFQNALRVAPGHVDSAREVRLAEMRAKEKLERAQSASIPFAGLFKRNNDSKKPGSS
jgi:tetratricopeptide (TPR) repeat protein